MKKKLISLLMTAAMVGSMMSGIVASASEETEAATEAASEAAGRKYRRRYQRQLGRCFGTGDTFLMVTTRPSTDAKDFYLDLLPELVHERFPNITIEVEQLRPISTSRQSG